MGLSNGVWKPVFYDSGIVHWSAPTGERGAITQPFSLLPLLPLPHLDSTSVLSFLEIYFTMLHLRGSSSSLSKTCFRFRFPFFPSGIFFTYLKFFKSQMVIVNKEDLNWRNFTNALLVTEVCDEKKTMLFFLLFFTDYFSLQYVQFFDL